MSTSLASTESVRAPVSVPPTEPLALRALRFLGLLTLAIAITFLTGLALLSAFPVLHAAMDPIVSWTTDSIQWSVLAGWLTVAFIVLVPAALLYAMWRFQLRSLWWIGGGWLLLAPVFVYLAIDDPVVRHPIAIEELAPAFPGAEKSFEVLMRYGKLQPAAKNFKIALLPAPIPDPDKAEAWRDYALKHRATIEKEWAELAPQRAWWTELNAFDRIGDLTPGRVDAEIVSFHVFRAVSQRGCLVATLQAIDGHGDEAIDTLLPILQVGRKLQPSARTLVRIMIGIVLERLSLRTANWILDHATISAAAKARLASVLQSGLGEAGARRIVTIDYAIGMQHLLEMKLGDIASFGRDGGVLRVPLNLASPFVYNPRASTNIYGAFLIELQELAARRDLNRMKLRGDEFFQQDLRPGFKNFMGSIIVNHAVPAYSKVVETYWNTEDLRNGLRTRLAAP